jgi:hypothetical protein
MLVPILVLQVAVAPPPPAAAQDQPVPNVQLSPHDPPNLSSPSLPTYPRLSYAPPLATTPRPHAVWFARVSLEAGFLISTEQTRFLQRDGYDLKSHVWFQADGAWMASPHVGVGGFGVMGGTSTQSTKGGTPQADDICRVGAQVPFVLGTDHLWLVLSARAGVG